MPSPSQIRAARAMLDWSRDDLAAASGLTAEGLFKIERGMTKPLKSTDDKIVRAFVSQGIVFTDDDGVRRHSGDVRIYKGPVAFNHWFEDVYETVKDGGDICITGGSEADYSRWFSPEEEERHVARMTVLDARVSCRFLLQQGDNNFAYPAYMTYRWIAREHWDSNGLYLYGLKSAFIEFAEEGPIVTVLDAPAATRRLRKLFQAIWETCRDIPPVRESA